MFFGGFQVLAIKNATEAALINRRTYFISTLNKGGYLVHSIFELELNVLPSCLIVTLMNLIIDLLSYLQMLITIAIKFHISTKNTNKY